MHKWALLITGWLLSSCVSSFQPQYYYNEILIANDSRQLVQDVTIHVVGTNRVFSCGNIAPRGICSNKMPPRPYLKKPIRITWVFGTIARQTSEFVLEVPPSMDTAIPLRGVLKVNPQGDISAFFEQTMPPGDNPPLNLKM